MDLFSDFLFFYRLKQYLASSDSVFHIVVAAVARLNETLAIYLRAKKNSTKVTDI